MSLPRFSILMPSYNQAHFQAAALESLRAQTVTDWEALVVDDGATDGTAELIDRYARLDRRFRPFHKPNGGTASALNEGLRHAAGEWILWLSADDLFEPDKLARHAEAIDRWPDARFHHTDFAMLDDASGMLTHAASPVRDNPPTVPWHIVSMFHVNYIDGITVCLHHDLVAAVGEFRGLFGYAQDVDFWLRAARLQAPLFLPHDTAVTRVHIGQGYIQNPERCFLDSARACADYLNTFGFADLFPGLDWTDRRQVREALSRLLATMASDGSFVWLGGLEDLLIARLREWLETPVGTPYRSMLPNMCEALPEKAPAGSSVRQRIGKMVEAVLDPAPTGSFQPADPFAVIAAHGRKLRERGHAPAADRMAAYLALYGRTADGVLAEPSK